MGKKNFNSLPEHIKAKLSMYKENLIEVCCVEKVNEENIDNYRHLGISITNKNISIKNNLILPDVSNGRFSKYNVEGRTIVRKDLPKITKFIPYELQDWGGNWHSGTYPKKVYQREFWEPKFLHLELNLIKQVNNNFFVKISVGVLDRTEEQFESELLFRCNLLQECVNNCDIYQAECSQEDYIKTAFVDWEIFPPGELSNERIYDSIPDNANKPTQEEFNERMDIIKEANPIEFIQGKGQFKSYFGAKFPNGKVVFENIYWGNALYVVHDNWEEVSKQPRSELMKIDPLNRNFTRIIHNKYWKENFLRAIK